MSHRSVLPLAAAVVMELIIKIEVSGVSAVPPLRQGDLLGPLHQMRIEIIRQQATAQEPPTHPPHPPLSRIGNVCLCFFFCMSGVVYIIVVRLMLRTRSSAAENNSHELNM